jgi:hypothetical protein
MFSYFGLPTIEGKDDRGASSPERPALHIPDPLSITTGTPFYSDINKIKIIGINKNHHIYERIN